VFTDEFLAALTGINFEAVRFMPFVGANDVEPEYPAVTEWSQRKLIDDASQAPINAIGKRGAASWDLVIDLVNLVSMDPWICIPVSATAEYVESLARLLLDSLDPSLNIYIESSNEVWNSIFPQQAYNLAQANDLGIGEQENHARRTVELAQIFQGVFGAGSLNNRVRAILASHDPMLRWWVEPMLEYIRQNIGEPSDYLYGISSQAYFTMPMQEGQSVEDILAEARDSITTSIDETGGVDEAGRMQWVATAEAWSLPGGYFIYEGGGHPTLGSLENIDNVITAERDSGMGELLKYNYGPGFLDAGGRLAMHFILSSAYTRYGSFGLTDDIAYPDRNYKYGALRELAGEGVSVDDRNIRHNQLFIKAPGVIAGRSDISFSVPGPGSKARLSIHDCRGIQVKLLWKGTSQSGSQQVSWDGTDTSGRHLSPGVYIMSLQSGSSRTSTPVVMMP
ncbi:FlgD immunoglobulin-like domain containing protein, partial [Fibrobacterota bacterium]